MNDRFGKWTRGVFPKTVRYSNGVDWSQSAAEEWTRDQSEINRSTGQAALEAIKVLWPEDQSRAQFSDVTTERQALISELKAEHARLSNTITALGFYVGLPSTDYLNALEHVLIGAKALIGLLEETSR